MDQETFNRIKDEAIEEVLKKHFKGGLNTHEKLAMSRLLEELLEEIMKGEREEMLKEAGYTIKDACSALGISRSGYYSAKEVRVIEWAEEDIKDCELLRRHLSRILCLGVEFGIEQLQ
jgi:hypothetical protein